MWVMTFFSSLLNWEVFNSTTLFNCLKLYSTKSFDSHNSYQSLVLAAMSFKQICTSQAFFVYIQLQAIGKVLLDEFAYETISASP